LSFIKRKTTSMWHRAAPHGMLRVGGSTHMAQSDLWRRTGYHRMLSLRGRLDGHLRRTHLMLYLASGASLLMVAVCAYVVTHAQ
jgi:hypothetical protein